MRAFESRTEVWREVGLGAEINRGDARKAGREAIVLLILIIGVIVAFDHRDSLLPDAGKGASLHHRRHHRRCSAGCSRGRLAQSLQPALFRRMEPGTAGTVGFLIRLGTIAIVIFAALRIAGVKPETLAVGGAFTAVVLGLAAQQTLAHVFAGLVLLTTRPFVVGDRVKFKGGSMAGEVEGVVSSQGLFYTTLVSGGDRTMIPNNVIMMLAVIPISEPDRVELKATFSADVTPQKLQRMIEKAVTIPLRTQAARPARGAQRGRGHGHDRRSAAQLRRRPEARQRRARAPFATATSTAAPTPTTCRPRRPTTRPRPESAKPERD